MPWSETSPMDQKRLFINAYVRGTLSISELCARFGVSRKTGYKWIRRFEAKGLPGLEDHSRRPRSSPFATDPDRTSAILELRRRHPFWGAKKLIQVLQRRDPRSTWPARSTVCDLLKRNGLVERRTRRRYPGHGGRPTTPMSASNEIWCADYKGEFKTGDGTYCYPLTVTDGYSRYLLACQGLDSTARAAVPRVRAPSGDSNRQRRPVCDHRAGAPESALGLVDPTRHLPRAHRTRTPRAERAPRADASNAEASHGSASGIDSPSAAATLQRLSHRVQRRASS